MLVVVLDASIGATFILESASAICWDRCFDCVEFLMVMFLRWMLDAVGYLIGGESSRVGADLWLISLVLRLSYGSCGPDQFEKNVYILYKASTVL